ncbi:MAG: hypothetical protein V1861_03240 [Candidatus Micrarchaeota archaeon]
MWFHTIENVEWVEIMTALKERLVFRHVLLGKKPEKEWPKTRIRHMEFYHAKFELEGRELNGMELVSEYSQRFPYEKPQTHRAELNRMLSECGIGQFSFLSPDVLRGFLLSSMALEEWKEYRPCLKDFQKREFGLADIRLRGRMLMLNVGVELLNQRNGTYYAFLDYVEDPKLHLTLRAIYGFRLMMDVFSRAEIAVFCPNRLCDATLSPEFLRNVLLSLKSEDDWKLWGRCADDFYGLKFEPPTYDAFSGKTLLAKYQATKRGSLKEMFAEAALDVGTDPSLKVEKSKDHYERVYPYDLLDPLQMRALLLQVCSEKEWNKPKDFADLRKKRVKITGKEQRGEELAVHTLMQIYCVQKYNSEQTKMTGKPSHLNLNDFQSNPVLIKFLRSNVENLKEMLDLAGIDYGKAFIPSITELDLRDPSVLRRLLLNGTSAALPMHARNAGGSWNIQDFRNTRFKDPKTGLEISGHGLLLYYSVLDYVAQHPVVSPSTAVYELRLGRSNTEVMRQILRASGIEKG